MVFFLLKIKRDLGYIQHTLYLGNYVFFKFFIKHVCVDKKVPKKAENLCLIGQIEIKSPLSRILTEPLNPHEGAKWTPKTIAFYF